MNSVGRVPIPASVREGLRHVYWIGGGSGSRKSTTARRLAAENGFRIYDTDNIMADHATRDLTRRQARLWRALSRRTRTSDG
jgi:predicted kinase